MNSWVRALVAEASSHQGDDAGHDRVGGGTLDPHPSAPVPFRVPANTSSPRCLQTGQRLTGDRGLVDLADPVQHLAVGADPLAGPDQHPVADGQVGGGHDALLAVGAAARVACSGARSSRAAHGVRGAAGGARLQGPGGGEDDDQQRAVEDLPDRRRAEGGHDHQQVDVQRPARAAPAARPGPAPSRRSRSRRGKAVHHDHAGAPASCSAPPARKSSSATAGPADLGQGHHAPQAGRGRWRGAGRAAAVAGRVDVDRVDGTMLLRGRDAPQP